MFPGRRSGRCAIRSVTSALEVKCLCLFGIFAKVISTPLSWDAAKADAESRGGYLAVVATEGGS